MAVTDRVPAVHPVDCDFDLIAVPVEKFALKFADRERVVNDENGLSRSQPRNGHVALYFLEAVGTGELLHRPDHILNIDDQCWRTVLHDCSSADVLDFPEPRVERAHHELSRVEEAVHEQSVSVMLIAHYYLSQFIARV